VFMPNLILLALLAAFPPLSTDMYLPAIPTLQAQWGISYATANLSMVLFMAVFSVFLLIHGPLSDRFGRKPVLIGGLILFILASFGCALSPSIGILITCRCLQAAGAAAAASLALALSKDLYGGPQRQKILAYIGVIMALAPMLAPSIGGLMLKFASWRWIFIVQVGLALIGLYGVLRLEEPVRAFTRGGFLAVAGRYRLVLKNLPFTVLASGFALMSLPHFAFIGGSADMYINELGLSEQAFGIYFGANAIGFMLGSFICTRMVGTYKPLTMLYTTFAFLFASTILMFILGGRTPLALALPMFCMSLSVGFSRPISNSMILDQVDTDVGAASGILTFEIFFIAALSMQLISWDWPNKPMVLGVLGVFGTLIPLTALLLVKKRCRFN
ncbi:MAG TPA: multidrug effflux MFS transporter, partial [Pseudodesulfovibrio sp.]|nr:multidrug effflux MFS transporter [Pseudodesulfovibrio sp.]